MLKVMTLIAITLICGCMQFSYEKPDGTRVTYSAPTLFGKQVDKLSATKVDGDVLFELENYRSETAGDVAGKVAEGVARGLR